MRRWVAVRNVYSNGGLAYGLRYTVVDTDSNRSWTRVYRMASVTSALAVWLTFTTTLDTATHYIGRDTVANVVNTCVIANITGTERLARTLSKTFGGMRSRRLFTFNTLIFVWTNVVLAAHERSILT